MTQERLDYAIATLEGLLAVLRGSKPVPYKESEIEPANNPTFFKGKAHHLTEQGIFFLNGLFSQGLDNAACADMMGISENGVKERRKKYDAEFDNKAE